MKYHKFYQQIGVLCPQTCCQYSSENTQAILSCQNYSFGQMYVVQKHFTLKLKSIFPFVLCMFSYIAQYFILYLL